MRTNSDFAALTQPGQVLASRRVLVASTSNFGAPLARVEDAAGAILSLDPSGPQVVVPSEFATPGGQATALDGRVQLYTAQSVPFTDPPNTPTTAALSSVSLPTGISINNGGRPWFSNAPDGSSGPGSVTILDPTGEPQAIFAGELTNGSPTSPGITSGALGTAAITKSPDSTALPVFAAVLADGSVVQVHASRGVDALAPPGTLTPVLGVSRETAESIEPGLVARQGIVFNWAPTLNLFITDPLANRIVVLDLADDGELFHVTATHEIAAEELDVPIDIAPAVREVASVNFASNTTLGGGSDVFVLNRGNNSIARLDLDGNVLAVRSVESDLGPYRANGIAVSFDGRALYLSAVLPDGDGGVLEVPAFGVNRGTRRLLHEANVAPGADLTSLGAALFGLELTPTEGLGPLFNAPSCGSCHLEPFLGGMGSLRETFVTRVGRVRRDGAFDDLVGRGGPVARAQSTGAGCGAPGIPRHADATSVRSAMTLRGNGLIDAVLLRDVLNYQAQQPPELRGRPHILADGRLGRFGWKAAVSTLVEFVGDAYRTEMGVTNPLAPDDFSGRGCNHPEAVDKQPEIDGLALTAAAAFLNTLEPPAPTTACLESPGAALFESLSCATCHAPSLPARSSRIALYSDLLLHDMGPGLADDVQQGSASGSEWRTMPLWRAQERVHFMHDGRSPTMTDAILQHGGQAEASRNAFEQLSYEERQDLLDFLNCI
jgi:hypothetical protein